ncbi:Candidapepsin-2 [Orbilia brochopaga]|nr:Candidapepsin-2 [Drechslerella brochopaga]
MSTDSVTWVPQMPASTAQFCSNSSNTDGCKIAGSVSGYYTPESKVDKSDFFNYTIVDSPGYNATGYWTETTASVGGVSVDLQIGVAENWHLIPSLGLGLWPTDPPQKGPSYLAALEQQGKIAGQYLSCYDLTDTTDSGTIVLGGVDLHKFSGKFTIWNNFNRPGVTTTPGVRVLLGDNVTTIPDTGAAQALVNPFTPFLYVPDTLLKLLLQALGATPINSVGAYGLPCNTQLDPTWTLEITYQKLVLSIPFQHLLSSAASAKGDLCFLALLPISYYNTPGYNISYVLGGPFFRAAYVVVNPSDNTTAIAVANPNVTTTSVVALGGPYGTPLSALEGIPPPSSTPSPSDTSSSSGKKSNTGAIVGGVVGGIAALLLIVAALWYFRRRRTIRRHEHDMPVAPAAAHEGHKSELPGGGVAHRPTNELDGYGVAAEVKSQEKTPLEPAGGQYAELPHDHVQPNQGYGANGGGYTHQPTGRQETFELAG